MNLDRVTITGADDSVDPEHIIELSEEFPFVEWGILFSEKHYGANRFPTGTWLGEFVRWVDEYNLSHPDAINICTHLCGKAFVRDFLQSGSFLFKLEKYNRGLFEHAQRVQLNFHSQKHGISPEAMEVINSQIAKRSFIVQYDGVNDAAMDKLIFGNNIRPLFDISGGAGRVPGQWPKPVDCGYHGYAGGLGPDNVLDQLEKIAQVSGSTRIWIDMETRVRSDDDRELDLDKVRRVLEQCAPFITK